MFMTKKTMKHGLSVVFLLMLLTIIPLNLGFITVDQAKAEGWWETVNQGGGLKEFDTVYGSNQTRDIRMVVVDIIKSILGFLGIIATVIILFAGFKWMMAGGNEEKVGEAKKMLIAGVIGLAIILFSYALATFVLKYLVAAANGTQVVW